MAFGHDSSFEFAFPLSHAAYSKPTLVAVVSFRYDSLRCVRELRSESRRNTVKSRDFIALPE
jgi:hypothetical protein